MVDLDVVNEDGPQIGKDAPEEQSEVYIWSAVVVLLKHAAHYNFAADACNDLRSVATGALVLS